MVRNKEKEKEKKRLAKEKREITDINEFSFGKDVNDLLLKMRSVPDGAKVKEVFLWELLLNATFALYQVRFESLVEASKHGAEPKLLIHIVPDKSKGTLSIIDNGIGMKKNVLVSKFRTITSEIHLRKFMKTIDNYLKPDADDVDVSCFYSSDWEIGLGFFSAYMVADKVVITTKQVGDKQYVWKFEANADSDFNGGSFTIDEDTSGERGTKVTLHLKENHHEYLEEPKLQELVKKYPKRIFPYPIFILDGNKNEKQLFVLDDDDDKENEDQFDMLREQFDGLRKLFVKFIGKKVKDIVISDRVRELPCTLSYDRKTLEINPRHPKMKQLKADSEADPNAEDVKYGIYWQLETCLNHILLFDRKYGTSFYQRVKRLSRIQWSV